MKKGAYILIALLSIASGINSLLMIVEIPVKFQDNLFLEIAFYAYFIYAGIALLTGWMLFSNILKRKQNKLHQKISKTYLIAALLSAVGGILLGIFIEPRISTKIGFILLNTVWLCTTIMAFLPAKKESKITHEDMLIYSFAIAFSVATFKFWLPLLTYLLDDYNVAYTVAIWESWLPNIFVAYMVIRRKKML
jgi:hypothetical protein